MKKTEKTKSLPVALLLLFSLFFNTLFAQQVQEVEMADELRASGKIYVVVAILSIVFSGIVIYLVSLDRKISKLEKELDQKNNK